MQICLRCCRSSPTQASLLPCAPTQRGQGDKRAAAELVRQEVRAAIEEDKAQVRSAGAVTAGAGVGMAPCVRVVSEPRPVVISFVEEWLPLPRINWQPPAQLRASMPPASSLHLYCRAAARGHVPAADRSSRGAAAATLATLTPGGAAAAGRPLWRRRWGRWRWRRDGHGVRNWRSAATESIQYPLYIPPSKPGRSLRMRRVGRAPCGGKAGLAAPAALL